MKIATLTLVLALAGTQASAMYKYCDASKKTTSKIDQLRIVELPYQVVQEEILKSLLSDKCVASRLSTEEVATLAGMLLDYNYADETAEQVIGEFLAQ